MTALAWGVLVAAWELKWWLLPMAVVCFVLWFGWEMYVAPEMEPIPDIEGEWARMNRGAR